MARTYTRLGDLLMLGGEQLGQMALAGELRREHLWTAVDGAERYREAIKAGDIAGNEEAEARAVKCRRCPSRTWTNSKVPGVRLGWCGNRFEDRPDDTPPTCGCFVLISVDGEIQPGAKPRVASESCPQQEW